MPYDHALPNMVAMVTSLGAMAALSALAVKMTGGRLAVVARLVAAGVFFSVFLHAGSELAETYGLIGTKRLMEVMGALLSVGSVLFCAAGIVGVRSFLAFTAHVESISLKQGSARRVALTSPDEIGHHLAAAFNRMVAELDAKQLEVDAERDRLVRAAHHWRATFDAIRDGVCVLDSGLRVLHANRAMHELLGAPADRGEGRRIGELLARLLGEVDAPDLDVGAGRVVRRNGNRWFELQRDPITLPGEATGFVQIVADVTRQQLLTEHLAQAQKMEAVGLLAGGVAHDFNNLLSIILTFASSLREELPAGELRSYALEIERAGNRAAGLTRQLLAFSRKQVLVPEVLEACEVLDNITHMIGRLIGEHIELVVNLSGSAGYVHMDPSLLEQALVNLAVNARDAMPDGGKLTIEARDVEHASGGTVLPGRLAPGPYLQIRVSDTGTGMDAATMARIFEPFFTTKAKGKGTGLGLALVYAAVDQSGGAIDVASSPGTGTAFTIHLPRVSGPARHAAQTAAGPAPRGEGQRILLVEDEPQLRAALSRFISTGGYEVIEASNGDEGIAAFHAENGRIDLVLTDLVMPGTGGLALGRAIRELSAVPVLYMSGYSEEVVSGKEHLRPEVFITKPFDRGTLLSRVRTAIAAVPLRPAVA
jgi:PAS domain S-box-containing protein